MVECAAPAPAVECETRIEPKAQRDCPSAAIATVGGRPAAAGATGSCSFSNASSMDAVSDHTVKVDPPAETKKRLSDSSVGGSAFTT